MFDVPLCNSVPGSLVLLVPCCVGSLFELTSLLLLVPSCPCSCWFPAVVGVSGDAGSLPAIVGVLAVAVPCCWLPRFSPWKRNFAPVSIPRKKRNSEPFPFLWMFRSEIPVVFLFRETESIPTKKRYDVYFNPNSKHQSWTENVGPVKQRLYQWSKFQRNTAQ